MTSHDFPVTTVLGYPRIGPRRELKRALESYWDGRSTSDDLRAVAADLRAQTWRRLSELGLSGIPSNTFSLYDHVLDTAVLVGAVPERYRALDDLDAYFAMARGTQALPPLRMTKWFDTNYHYLVPEIDAATPLRLAGDKPLREYREAKELGIATRPVLLGPVTFLALAHGVDGYDPFARLDDLLGVYAELLGRLAAEGVAWVQLDEPALVTDLTAAQLDAVGRAYTALTAVASRPRLLVAGYFGDLGAALPVLAAAPVDAIALDLVRGGLPADLTPLRGTTVVAGVVSGRDVWRTDANTALHAIDALRAAGARVTVGSSCPLLHVPYDLDQETELAPDLRARLAFAEQKVREIVALAAAPGPSGPPASAHVTAGFGVTAQATRSPFAVRAAAQAARLNLPPLPTTTIGSFPQTAELRAARASFAAGTLAAPDYEARLKQEVEQVIRLQERLGLDVLVHGEPERNDMVQFFAELLDGCAVTRHGWVQSYGSRCTRPPIIHDDVRRTAPMTVELAAYAQSLTDRPVKGMLTGPVTITAWSFVRRDIPLRDVVWQIAEALRGEVADLEAAGIGVIQVDEPALRELLPLRRAEQASYLEWAVGAYRWATSSAADATQIHTHLCYSNAAEVVEAIDGLDADVTTVESARSAGAILGAPGIGAYARGLGPGVYDIHSPRVPSAEEVEELLREALAVLPPERLWVNPDCGLKTRTFTQVEAALTNVVTAAAKVRASL
ncbi:MAG: 5-methyltetrahydropteroyltriglutamate--homocysteine S-methyltransferase [Hamadaea sp.]|nr:5-methyltetrahydropteroyltriglutamate--homocysteine S-methyltransferase [Hamadaea sp.]